MQKKVGASVGCAANWAFLRRLITNGYIGLYRRQSKKTFYWLNLFGSMTSNTTIFWATDG